jgi:hypothetical protein
MKIIRKLLTKEELEKREMNNILGGTNDNNATGCTCKGSCNDVSGCNDNTNNASDCNCKGNHSNTNDFASCKCS